MTFLLICIYFYLPVALANVGANLGKLVPIFKDIKQPLDFGKSINGVRIVGEHKNFGSLFFGILFGTFCGLIKTFYLDSHFSNYLLIKSTPDQLITLYFFMSTAALLGDVLKSILKRLLHRPPHSPWIPFDEIDHSLASMIVAKIFIPSISWTTVFTIVIVFFVIHILTNIVGYALKLKDVPY